MLLYGCLYITISILSIVFVYKYLSLGLYTIGLGAVIMPFWYALGDAIAELFGYKIARKLIYINVICCIFFAVIATVLVWLPAPSTWHHQDAYEYIFGMLLRVSFGGEISILIGAFLNAYFITKWKVLLKGKYFWLRSLGSSLIGVTTQISVAATFIYLGQIGMSKFFMLLFLSILTHIMVSFIIVWPNALIVRFLKFWLAPASNRSIQINPYVTE